MAGFSKMALVYGIVTVFLAPLTQGYEGWNLSVGLQRNPLSNSVAVSKLKSAVPSAQYVKLFSFDKALVDAVVAGGIRNVVVAIPNPQVGGLSGSDVVANAMADVLAPHYRAGVQFTVAVSNEPTSNGVVQFVLPALRTVRRVLNQRGLNGVKLTVPFDYGILGNSYPPAAGTLAGGVKSAVAGIAAFLRDDRGPFFINIYPFFSRPGVALDYTLLQTSHTVGGVTYSTILHAQVAALRAALLNADGSFSGGALPIVIGETGWPSGGGNDASVANAATYYQNARSKATDLNMYFFEAFDEGRKPGPTFEQFFGFMTEDGTPKFQAPPPQPGINWQMGADGYWAMSCDFRTTDLKSAPSTGDKCSTVCKGNKGCTHYTWTNFNGGTCWMKQGAVARSDAIKISDAGAVCGINSAIAWSGNWAPGCDFKGQDLKSSKTAASGCGPACQATAGCTHFTWTSYSGGTCWMKQGPTSKLDAFATGDTTVLCGVL